MKKILLKKLLLSSFVFISNLHARAITEENKDYYTSTIPTSTAFVISQSPAKSTAAPEPAGSSEADPPYSPPVTSITLQQLVEQNLFKVSDSMLAPAIKFPSDTRQFANTTAAGVLPVSIDPSTKEVMVLLGLEYRWWDASPGVWLTDFGGKRDTPTESDSLLTATREFTEQTAGIYPLHKVNEPDSYKRITYAGRRDTQLLHSTTGPNSYASYLVRMPYIARETIQTRATALRQSTGVSVKKDDYYWVKLSDLLTKDKEFSITYSGPPLALRSEKTVKTGDIIKLFPTFWDSILSNPAVREYLIDLIRENTPGAITPPSVPPVVSPPVVTPPSSLIQLPAAMSNVVPARSPISGAGVLPISIDPETRKVVVLFGDEVNPVSHIDGFADFGGNLDEGETAQKGALREFMEETSLAFWESFSTSPIDRITISQTEILTKATSSTQFASKAVPLYYVPAQTYLTHVLAVPYQKPEDIARNVQAIRNRITNRNAKTHAFFEKNAFAWVPLENVIAYLQNLSAYPVTTARRLSWRFVGGRDKFQANSNKVWVIQYLQSIVDMNKG